MITIFTGLTSILILIAQPIYSPILIQTYIIYFTPPIAIWANVLYIIALNITIWPTMFMYIRIAIKISGTRLNSLSTALGIPLLALGKSLSFRITDFIFINENIEMLLGSITILVGFILIYTGFYGRLKEI
ncbi:MAG: hypothetical protein GF329_09335 [Candidatus Lokiarchaeota archaeon]|nr:hypothetical protein [Candidatus Lokiarchaeota archaeon]